MVALATALGLGVAACAAGDDGGAADQAPVTSPPTTEATTSTATEATGSTTTGSAPTAPPGTTATVPADPALLALVPDLPGERKVDDDEDFDTRLCDGSTPEDVPDAQATVTFEDGTQVTTVGLFRFAEGDPYTYLQVYRDAIGQCSTGGRTPVETLDLGPEGAYLVDLDTEDTVGLVVLTVTDDVLWVVYRRSAEAVELDDRDLDLLDDAFFRA